MEELRQFDHSGDLFATIQEGIDFVNKNAEEGCICPCCGQIVKSYRWKMYSMTVHFLWWLSMQKDFKGHYKDFIKQTGISDNISNFSTPRYWNFIQPVGKKSGTWQLTQEGFDFLHGKPFPKYVRVRDKKVLNYSDEQIIVVISQSEKFDYEELTTFPEDFNSKSLPSEDLDDDW